MHYPNVSNRRFSSSLLLNFCIIIKRKLYFGNIVLQRSSWSSSAIYKQPLKYTRLSFYENKKKGQLHQYISVWKLSYLRLNSKEYILNWIVFFSSTNNTILRTKSIQYNLKIFFPKKCKFVRFSRLRVYELYYSQS